ncbi:MAG: hypothetical protein LBH13_01235 [Cellulomonadaceae bacterium]|jgi:hypothetical protein|nr:hypothetical protein [Cellulomonadaceae bacterium]
MSAVRAIATPAPRKPAAKNSRPTLTAIQGGKAERAARFSVIKAPLNARSGAPFLVLCAAILVASLVAVLIVNTQMASGAYEAARLTSEVNKTQQDAQMYIQQLRQAEAGLSERAMDIGMVPAENPKILNISKASGAIAAEAAQRAAEARAAEDGGR